MKGKDFVTYEYKTKTAKPKNLSRVMDMYEAFGWEITATTPSPVDGVTISLKRDRNQKHKQELSKLERQAEDVFKTLNGLERSMTLGASIFAYIFGSISALIFGGGMCLSMLIKNSISAFVGGVILGLVGIALCGINYLIYKKLATKKTQQLLPIIDETEEKFANILERGNDLLGTDII